MHDSLLAPFIREFYFPDAAQMDVTDFFHEPATSVNIWIMNTIFKRCICHTKYMKCIETCEMEQRKKKIYLQ